MSDDARPTPDVTSSGADGPVAVPHPEVARGIAEFKAKRAQIEEAHAAEKQARKHETINALDSALRRQATRSHEAPAAAPKPAPATEGKLPEHLAAARARVTNKRNVEDANYTARMAEAASKEKGDRRSQREVAERSPERADPPPAAKTERAGVTGSGGTDRRRRGERRSSKKPMKPERTPQEHDAAARKRADADPGALLKYAVSGGWTWLYSQIERWERLIPSFESGKSIDVGVLQAEAKAKTPRWRAHKVRFLTLGVQQGDYRDDDRSRYVVGKALVKHLVALPEASGSESGRSLLAALVEQLPTPAEWDTRQHKNLPALLANTRTVVTRPIFVDDQPHLPFDYAAPTSAPPRNEPRYEIPAWLPDWEPPSSKLITSPIVDVWDSGPPCGYHGPCPVANRMGWEALLAPAPGDYIGGVADVRIKLGNMALMIWPNTGRYKRTVHGYQLRDGARGLNDPDNAMRWGADADAPPTNLVLWYRAPEYPYNPDQEVCAYVTAPDGGRRRGAQIDNHQRRILAATSYRQHRVYVNACILFDRHATFRGYLVQLTVPEVNRNSAGYVLGPDGKVATEKDGRPSRRATHHLAVQTGKRLPNPAMEKAYPWLEGEDTILVAHPRVAETPRKRNMQRAYTIKTLFELRVAGKYRDSVLDFEARYRGTGVLSGVELEQIKEKEKKLPPANELEAVRMLPVTSHFAAYQARNEKAEKAKKAHRRRKG